MDTSKPTLTFEQGRQEANLGETRFREEIRSGRLPAKKVGSKILILRTDFEAYLENLPNAATGEMEQLELPLDTKESA